MSTKLNAVARLKASSEILSNYEDDEWAKEALDKLVKLNGMTKKDADKLIRGNTIKLSAEAGTSLIKILKKTKLGILQKINTKVGIGLSCILDEDPEEPGEGAGLSVAIKDDISSVWLFS